MPTLGRHVYTVGYDISGFVQSYPDKDGFGYWFADLNDGDPIKSFRLTVTAPVALSATNCQVWGFGYRGTARLAGGIVRASSTGEIGKIGLLMSLGKGVLSPALKGNGTFSQLKEKAFKGSDFGGGSEGEPAPLAVWIVVGCAGAALLAWFTVLGVKAHRKRRKARELPYFKQVSSSWSLLKAARALNEYGWYDKENLIGAMILRLLGQKKLAIADLTQPDKRGKTKKALKVTAESTCIPADEACTDAYLCGYLLHIMACAVADDGVLTSSKFEAWAEQHEEELANFDKALGVDSCEAKLSDEDTCHLLGLRNYLADLGKTDGWRMADAGSWDNDLLVYACLFGFTRKLSKALKTTCPELLELSSLAHDIDDLQCRNAYYLYYLSATITSCSSNSADSSSYGGGGGGR